MADIRKGMLQMTDKLITSTEAARQSGITRERIIRRLATGEIQGEFLAGRWLIREQSLEDYVARLAHQRDDRLALRVLNLGILAAESLCASVNNPPPPTAPYPAPALRKWWAELRVGTRTVTTFDALWRAACRDQAILDAQRDGIDTAQHHLDHARAALDGSAA